MEASFEDRKKVFKLKIRPLRSHHDHLVSKMKKLKLNPQNWSNTILSN